MQVMYNIFKDIIVVSLTQIDLERKIEEIKKGFRGKKNLKLK